MVGVQEVGQDMEVSEEMVSLLLTVVEAEEEAEAAKVVQGKTQMPPPVARLGQAGVEPAVTRELVM